MPLQKGGGSVQENRLFALWGGGGGGRETGEVLKRNGGRHGVSQPIITPPPDRSRQFNISHTQCYNYHFFTSLHVMM